MAPTSHQAVTASDDGWTLVTGSGTADRSGLFRWAQRFRVDGVRGVHVVVEHPDLPPSAAADPGPPGRGADRDGGSPPMPLAAGRPAPGATGPGGRGRRVRRGVRTAQRMKRAAEKQSRRDHGRGDVKLMRLGPSRSPSRGRPFCAGPDVPRSGTEPQSQALDTRGAPVRSAGHLVLGGGGTHRGPLAHYVFCRTRPGRRHGPRHWLHRRQCHRRRRSRWHRRVSAPRRRSRPGDPTASVPVESDVAGLVVDNLAVRRGRQVTVPPAPGRARRLALPGATTCRDAGPRPTCSTLPRDCRVDIEIGPDTRRS